MDKTPIQKRIEFLVTNGLGYETSTLFLKDRTDLTWTEKKIYEFLVQEEDVRSTKDSLKTHLFELTCKNRVPEDKMQEYLGHLKTLKSRAIYDAGMKAITGFRFNGKVLHERIEGFLATQYSR